MARAYKPAVDTLLDATRTTVAAVIPSAIAARLRILRRRRRTSDRVMIRVSILAAFSVGWVPQKLLRRVSVAKGAR